MATVVQIRISNFELLLEHNTTPLLQEELRHAIKLHRKALESESISCFSEDLNTAHAKIEQHWKRVYADMLTTASLLWCMRIFDHFLRSKLLEDYANVPYIVSGPALTFAKLIAKQHHRDPREGIVDETYQSYVVFPLEEYKLDRDTIEDKLIAVAAREGHPGSDIQPLIDTRNWAKLAAVLMGDRDIITKLTERSACPSEISDLILAGISRVQNEHFASLTSPSTFTLAPTRDKSSLFPRLSFRSTAYDALASGFKWNSSRARIENSSDDRLILLEEADLSSSMINLKKVE